jgi:hypothetical protein
MRLMVGVGLIAFAWAVILPALPRSRESVLPLGTHDEQAAQGTRLQHRDWMRKFETPGGTLLGEPCITLGETSVGRRNAVPKTTIEGQLPVARSC